MPYTNITKKNYDTGDYPQSVVNASAMIKLTDVRERQRGGEPDGRLIGIGFATFTEQTAHGTAVFAAWGLPLVPGYEQAMVKLSPSGSIEVHSGNQGIGQGIETTIAQCASDVLGVSYDDIKVKLGDTGDTPYSTGCYASRGIVMAGGAVAKAADGLADRIRKIAGHLMMCEADAIELRDAKAMYDDKEVTFAEVAKAWYLTPQQLPGDVNTLGLEVTDGYKPDVDTGVFTYASHAAVVAVDPNTGQVEVLDYVVYEDCGRRVNPLILEGQAYGGVAQGIGTALFEEVLYDGQGQPLTSSLADYILPGAAELPFIRIGHVESPSPHTRFGMKGVGEGAAIAPAGAVVNAINDAIKALGAEINEVPATPHKVLSAILQAQVAA